MVQPTFDQSGAPVGTATKPKGMSGPVKLLIGCAVLVPLLVCCVGVLASTAIPAFLNFTARSKTAETGIQLRALSEAVMRRCADGEAPVSAGPLPLRPDSTRQVTDFSVDPGFAALGFQPREPLYYQYSVRLEADGVTAILAQGDLDGDGALSTFEVSCGPTCTCAPIYIENELE